MNIPTVLSLVLVLQSPLPQQAPFGETARPFQPAWRRPAAVSRGEKVQPHPSVARVIVPERDGFSYGSGTLVDAVGEFGLVLTNWHVVRDASGPVTVVFPDGFRSGAKIEKVDRDWDLAALVIWRPEAAPVRVASQDPQPGDPLTIAGYGPGLYRSASGRCTQYLSPGRNLPFELVELSAAARQGDSGGPILNARGELAGVLFGADGRTTSGSCCGRLQQFLASVTPDASERRQAMIAANEPGEEYTEKGPPAESKLPPITDDPDVEMAANEELVNSEPSELADEVAAESDIADDAPAAADDAWQPHIEREEATELVAEMNEAATIRRLPATSGDDSAAAPPASMQASADYDDVHWQDLIGNSRGEQIKSALAALGILTLVAQAWRVVGRTRAA